MSEDGRWLTLFAVNDGLSPLTRSMDLSSFLSGAADVQVVTLGDTQHTGHPDVTNGFDDPHRVYPVPSSFHAGSPSLTYNFPPLSLTVLRLKRKWFDGATSAL